MNIYSKQMCLVFRYEYFFSIEKINRIRIRYYPASKMQKKSCGSDPAHTENNPLMVHFNPLFSFLL